jgi:hypothetical protein
METDSESSNLTQSTSTTQTLASKLAKQTNKRKADQAEVESTRVKNKR